MSDLDAATQKKITDFIGSDDVVLFMKGRRRMPQCGFSAQVVGILDQLLENYTTVNVLTDPDVRQGIKDFSSWPTIPQLYVKGKFVGGCDIVVEMAQQGELQTILGVEPEEVAPPDYTVSDSAKEVLLEALKQEGGEAVRLTIDARFRPSLGVDRIGPLDLRVEANDVVFAVDRGTAKRSNGLSIEFIQGDGGGFKLDNPNEPPKVGQMSSQVLAQWLKDGKTFELIDVRTDDERAKAKIEGARLLDETYKAELLDMPKDTPMVFQCHHGGRSQAAAEFFLGQGFTKVNNLVGGIDAWSTEVDSSIPRY